MTDRSVHNLSPAEGPFSQKLRLLEEVYLNSRVHTNQLSEKIGLSRQTTSKYLKYLWKKRILQSPTILLDPQVLNLQYYFMEIKTNPSEQSLLDKLKQMPEIVSIDGILGEYSLLLKFEIQNKKQFSDILTKIDQDISQTFFSSYRIIECIDIFKAGGFVFEKSYPGKPLEENDKKWQLLQLLRKNHNIRRWPEDPADQPANLPKTAPTGRFSPDEYQRLLDANLSREFSQFDEDHIIAQFTATYDLQGVVGFLQKSDRYFAQTDFDTKFYLQIKPKRISDYTDLANQLKCLPNIIDLYRTGSEAGLLAVVRTKDLQEYNRFIQNLYLKYEVRDTLTVVVVEEQIPSICPPSLEAARLACKLKRE